MCIYYDSSCIATFSNLIDSRVHSHYFMQIVISLDKSFQIAFDGVVIESQNVLIDTAVKHQLDGQNNWQFYLLIDPNSQLGNKIRKKRLKNCGFSFLEEESSQQLKTILNDFDRQTESKHDFKRLLFELECILLTGCEQHHGLDSRVIKVRKILSTCDLNKITVTKLCKMVFLSESRLSHLFKDEMGISISSYLLSLKLRRAMELVQLGRSCTDAAYEAGFSDSAHLSRTFKKNFGISPKNLKAKVAMPC